MDYGILLLKAINDFHWFQMKYKLQYGIEINSLMTLQVQVKNYIKI